MRMRPEDVEFGSNQEPTDVQCSHLTEIIPMPTPNGFMFALKVVSHGDPGERVHDDDAYVNREDIRTTLYGMNESDLIALANEVHGALAFVTGVMGSAN